MEKYSFTPLGVQQFMDYLYSLSEEQLQLEIQNASADFVTWLSANFSFTEKQARYLHGLPPAALDLMSDKVIQALDLRSPIVLSKEGGDDEEEEDHPGKIIDFDQKSSATYSAQLGLGQVHLLTIRIQYLHRA